jgi:hypothetical protein
MNEWLHRMILTEEPLGEKIFHILIVIFAFLFVFFWVWMIINLVLNWIIDFIKWVIKKRGRYNSDVDYKIFLIEEKVEKIFQAPFKTNSDASTVLNSSNKRKLHLIKSIIIGLAIPIVGVWIWYAASDNPVNEYLLITKSKTTNGFITKADEQDDIVETNDGRSSEQVFYYYYEYKFLVNGKAFISYGNEDGTLPDDLTNLAEKSFPIEVEYLPENPQISRVKGMPSGHTTVYEWLRYSVLMGVIVFLICSYFGFMSIRNGIKQYSNSNEKKISTH